MSIQSKDREENSWNKYSRQNHIKTCTEGSSIRQTHKEGKRGHKVNILESQKEMKVW